MLAGSCIWTWSTFLVSGRTVGRSENLIGGRGVQSSNPTPFEGEGFVSKELLYQSCYFPSVIVLQNQFKIQMLRLFTKSRLTNSVRQLQCVCKFEFWIDFL